MKTTIGKKLVVALTGLLLIGFVVIHLSGNLLLYAGFENYNHYAHTLHSMAILPIAEIGLFALFIAHVVYAIKTVRENKAARSQKYAQRRSKLGKPPWAPSSTMFISGAIVLGFLLLHLSDFRFDLRLPGASGELPADRAFRILQNPITAVVYFFGSLFLGYHLSHGFQSLFQTLGLNHPKYTPWIKRFGIFLSIVLALGFASFPIWALFKA